MSFLFWIYRLPGSPKVNNKKKKEVFEMVSLNKDNIPDRKSLKLA